MAFEMTHDKRGSSMIAVVEKKNKVVWGVGLNNADAMASALLEISGKPQFKINKSDLEYSPLKEDAPIHLDGKTLFDFCLLDAPNTTTQFGLF